MEASGLSDPSGIGEIFNDSGLKKLIYLAGSICIVDANNFLKLEPFQQRVKHQVMIADYVVINKTDLIKDLQQIITKIKTLNPFGKKFITQYCNISIEEIFSEKSSIPLL